MAPFITTIDKNKSKKVTNHNYDFIQNNSFFSGQPVIFHQIQGNLMNLNNVVLSGWSMTLSSKFKISIYKTSVMFRELEGFSWNEAEYYLNVNGLFYIIQITIGGSSSSRFTEPIEIEYQRLGIPPLVYSAIIGSVTTQL